MDVNVVDDEALAWSNVKAPANPVDLKIPVNLTAFFQGSFFNF